MNRFTPIVGVLPKSQATLLPELAFAADLGFTLYGGTAIALRLGHRESLDFDFFSERPLDKTRILKDHSLLENGAVVQDTDDTLTLSVDRDGPVKVSFFGDLVPRRIAGRVGDVEFTDNGILAVASLDDLFATKVKVILDRAEAKDYIDIVALLRAGRSLDVALASACTIFGSTFAPASSLKALSFFEDGDLHRLSKADRQFLIDSAAREHVLTTVALRSTHLSADLR